MAQAEVVLSLTEGEEMLPQLTRATLWGQLILRRPPLRTDCGHVASILGVLATALVRVHHSPDGAKRQRWHDGRLLGNSDSTDRAVSTWTLGVRVVVNQRRVRRIK